MKKILILSAILFLSMGCKQLSDQATVTKYEREQYAQSLDSMATAIKKGKDPIDYSSFVENVTTFPTYYHSRIQVYKVKVDSSEYVVVTGIDAIAIVKHK